MTRVLAVALAVFIAACAQRGGLHSFGAGAAEPEVRRTLRADGSAIEWRLDRGAARGSQGVLVLAQGSGCNPAAGNPNLAAARVVAPGFAAVTVEKFGVTGEGAAPQQAGVPKVEGCPQAYLRGHTVSQRVEDYARVLDELKREPWWNGDLVLFGGSEGGAAMAMLAPGVPESDAVVILSTGTGRPLAETFKAAIPPHVAAQADAMLARIRANPQSTEVWGGNSFRWWADIMDRTLADDLLRTNAPILLIHGEMDVPVSAARATRDAFAEAGRTNLTYWEKAGFDHGMKDRSGVNHITEVLAEAGTWVRQTLARRPQSR